MDLAGVLEQGVLELAGGALKTAAFQREAARQLKTFIAAQGRSVRLRRENAVQGMDIPPFLIASVTQSCNLQCRGCYAHANEKSCAGISPLGADRWGELFAEARSLGVSYILIAGGEPLMRPEILRKAADIKEIIFPVFTNGVLLDEAAAEMFRRCRNLIPVISLEGGAAATDTRRGPGVYEKVTAAMRLLKQKRVLFGVSVTYTKGNIQEITDPSFARDLRKQGAGILFFVEYVPSDGVSEHLAPDAEARAVFEQRLVLLRKSTRLLVISFPGDEDFTDGCLAAGRGFVHINHAGGLEPCPFSPYSDVSVREQPLKAALASPFLKSVREDGMLKGEHKGGCLLWERRGEVERLLQGREG